METIFAAVALVVSLVSLAGIAVLFQNRQDVTNVESKLRNIELEVADLVDRLSIWQRRDAARQRRNVGGDAADQLGGSVSDQHGVSDMRAGKDRLRNAARARGLIR